jgi:hypothetical protein
MTPLHGESQLAHNLDGGMAAIPSRIDSKLPTALVVSRCHPRLRCSSTAGCGSGGAAGIEGVPVAAGSGPSRRVCLTTPPSSGIVLCRRNSHIFQTRPWRPRTSLPDHVICLCLQIRRLWVRTNAAETDVLVHPTCTPRRILPVTHGQPRDRQHETNWISTRP